MDSLSPLALASSKLVPQLRMHAQLKQRTYMENFPTNLSAYSGGHAVEAGSEATPAAAAAAVQTSPDQFEAGTNCSSMGSHALPLERLFKILQFGLGDFLSLSDWCVLRLASRRCLRAAGRLFRGRLSVSLAALCSTHRIITVPYSWLPTLLAAGSFSAAKVPPASRTAPPSSCTQAAPSDGSSFWLPPDTQVVPILDQEFTLVLPSTTPESFLGKLKRTGANQRMAWVPPVEAEQRMKRFTTRWGGLQDTVSTHSWTEAQHQGFAGELRLVFPFEFKWSNETQIPGAVGAAAIGALPREWAHSIHSLQVKGKVSSHVAHSLGEFVQAKGVQGGAGILCVSFPSLGCHGAHNAPSLGLDTAFDVVAADYNVYRDLPVVGGSASAGGGGRTATAMSEAGYDTDSAAAAALVRSMVGALRGCASSISMRHSWDSGKDPADDATATAAVLQSLLPRVEAAATAGSGGNGPSHPAFTPLSSLALTSGSVQCPVITSMQLPTLMRYLGHYSNLTKLDLSWPAASVARSPNANLALARGVGDLPLLQELNVTSWQLGGFVTPRLHQLPAAMTAGEDTAASAEQYAALSEHCTTVFCSALSRLRQTLRVLSLGRAPRSGVFLVQLAAALLHAPYLHTLDLFSSGLQPQDGAVLCELLRKLPELRYVALGNNAEFGEGGCEYIAFILPHLNKLRTLVLTNTGQTDASCRRLLGAVRGTPFPQLPLTALHVTASEEQGTAPVDLQLLLTMRWQHFRWVLQQSGAPPTPPAVQAQWACRGRILQSIPARLQCTQGMSGSCFDLQSTPQWLAARSATLGSQLVGVPPPAASNAQFQLDEEQWPVFHIEQAGQATDCVLAALHTFPSDQLSTDAHPCDLWSHQSTPPLMVLQGGNSAARKRLTAVLQNWAHFCSCDQASIPTEVGIYADRDFAHPGWWDPAWAPRWGVEGGGREFRMSLACQGGDEVTSRTEVVALLSALKLLLPFVRQLTALTLKRCALDVPASFQVGSLFAIAPACMRDLAEVDLSGNPQMGDKGVKAAIWPLLRHITAPQLWQIRVDGSGMTVASAALLASVLHTARPQCLSIGTLAPAGRGAVCTALATAIVATQEEGGAGGGELQFLGHSALEVQSQCIATMTASSHSGLVHRRLEDLAALYGSMVTEAGL